MELPRLLKDRILRPFAEWYLVSFLMDGSKSSSLDALAEVVYRVNILACLCTYFDGDWTPVCEQRV